MVIGDEDKTSKVALWVIVTGTKAALWGDMVNNKLIYAAFYLIPCLLCLFLFCPAVGTVHI